MLLGAKLQQSIRHRVKLQQLQGVNCSTAQLGVRGLVFLGGRGEGKLQHSNTGGRVVSAPSSSRLAASAALPCLRTPQACMPA